jgi:Tfp pilus assembly protein PilV
MGNKRGSVLVHVLITSIVVVMIATGLAQMLLMRYSATMRATQGTARRREDDGTLNRLVTYWNANGYCSSPGGGLTCSGVTATCTSCTCSLAAVAPYTVAGTLTATGTYPACALKITGQKMTATE